MRGNAAKSPEACFAAVERPRWEQRAQKMWPDCGWTAGQPVLLRLLPLQHPEGKGRCLCVLVGGRVLSLSLSQTPWENSNSGMYFATPGVRWGCSKVGGGSRQVPTGSLSPLPHPKALLGLTQAHPQVVAQASVGRGKRAAPRRTGRFGGSTGPPPLRQCHGYPGTPVHL